MKDTLKRLLGITPEPAQAETTQEDVTMIDENVAVEATTETADVASLQASVTDLTAQLATALGQVAELTELVAKATEFQAAKAKAEAELKVANRLTKLSTLVGDVEGEKLNTSLASLDDVAFDSVLSSLGAKSVAEASTPLFKEVGVDGEVDAVKLADESKTRVMDYLTSKYQQAK